MQKYQFDFDTIFRKFSNRSRSTLSIYLVIIHASFTL